MKTVKIELNVLNYKGLVERLSGLLEDVKLFQSVIEESGITLLETEENGESYRLDCNSLRDN